jgi:hypothetical protein
MVQIQIQEKRKKFSAVRALFLHRHYNQPCCTRRNPRWQKAMYQQNQCPEIQLVRASTPFGNLPFIKPMLIAVLPEIGHPDGMSS